MEARFLISSFRSDQYPPPDRPEVAFAGRSNVGKSSLINKLVNRKNLARTSSTPGRTQSINFFSIGVSMYFVDLPGYGFARVPLNVKKSWQRMVEDYLKSRKNLAAVVVILDIRRDLSSGDRALIGWLKHYKINNLIVLTKVDKLSRQQAISRANVIENELSGLSSSKPIKFSSKTGQGKDEMWEHIRQITNINIGKD
jgi:GTP-binding protein